MADLWVVWHWSTSRYKETCPPLHRMCLVRPMWAIKKVLCQHATPHWLRPILKDLSWAFLNRVLQVRSSGKSRAEVSQTFVKKMWGQRVGLFDLCEIGAALGTNQVKQKCWSIQSSFRGLTLLFSRQCFFTVYWQAFMVLSVRSIVTAS